MSYTFVLHPKCRKEINRASKKDPVLKKVLENKIREIILNPAHYKPLRYELKGERRVHIFKKFVLKFEIDETRKTVVFLAFTHHDKAYKW